MPGGEPYIYTLLRHYLFIFPASISLPFDGSAFLITRISLFSCSIKETVIGGTAPRGTCEDHTPAGWRTEAPPSTPASASPTIPPVRFPPRLHNTPASVLHPGCSQSSASLSPPSALTPLLSFIPHHHHHHPLTPPPSSSCWLHNPHHHLLNPLYSNTHQTQEITLKPVEGKIVVNVEVLYFS